MALKEELKQRKEIERPRIVLAIEEARAHGDLSENAEYSAAKEAQSHNEGRLSKLEELVALADVVDPSTLSGNKVVFGATVTIEETDSGEQQTFAIVGEHEGDIKAGKMSYTSPVARALIGHRVGETVQSQDASWQPRIRDRPSSFCPSTSRPLPDPKVLAMKPTTQPLLNLRATTARRHSSRRLHRLCGAAAAAVRRD